MYVSRSDRVGTYTLPGQDKTREARKTLGKEDFLQLLITQLRNMNIGEGSTNQEFIAQMAQFTTLEELQNMNRGMQAMMGLQLISQAGSIVGKKIEALPPGYSSPVSGVAETVEVIAGIPYLTVSGQRVHIAHITRIF